MSDQTNETANTEAIDIYNQAINLDPNYIDAYFNKGIVLNDLGRKEEAIELYNQAIKINDNNKNETYVPKRHNLHC